jgi:hypothetical protein
MPNRTRHPVQSLQPALQGRSIPPDPALNERVAAVMRAGVVAGVRIQTGGIVACGAVHSAAMVSQAADAAFRTSPLGESEFRGIVMAFGNFARAEIEGLGFHEGER